MQAQPQHCGMLVDHSPQGHMVFMPTAPFGSVMQHGCEADAEDGRHGSGKRAGRHAQQQASVKDFPINQMKNHAITSREPPWTDVTTVMMRNLPNKYSQQLLLEELASHGFHLQTDFDFFYLPMDHSSAVNLGYCFINFCDTPVANNFAATFSGKRMRRFNSSKTVVVMPASIQGYERNFIYYSSTKVSQAQDPQYRPIFCHQMQSPMLPPTVLVTQAPAAYMGSSGDVTGTMWAAPSAMQVKDWSPEYWTGQVDMSQQWLGQQVYGEGGETEDRYQWLSQGTNCGPYDDENLLGSLAPPTVAAASAPAAECLAPLPPTSTIQESRSSRADRVRIRNTFLDEPVERSPSVERFLAERQVKSCPVSAPRSEAGSGRIELAAHGPLSRTQQAFVNHDVSLRWDSHILAAAKYLEHGDVSEPTGGETASSAGTSRTGSSNTASPGLQPEAPKRTGSSSSGSADFVGLVEPDAGERFDALSEDLPSKGSSLHRWGNCKPCAFHCANAEMAKGCKNGAECTFCHLCDPGEKKRRKKERQVAKREGRDWVVGRAGGL